MANSPATAPGLSPRACRYTISIVENWLAPQPTANIANATRTHPRAAGVLTGVLAEVVNVMPPTTVRFCAGRGGRDLPVAGQRAPEEARRGRPGPRRAERAPAAVFARRAAGRGRAGDLDPVRQATAGSLAGRFGTHAEPALGADVLRPPRGGRRGSRDRGAAGPGRGPLGGRKLRARARRRRRVRRAGDRCGRPAAAAPAPAAAVRGLDRAPASPGRRHGRRGRGVTGSARLDTPARGQPDRHGNAGRGDRAARLAQYRPRATTAGLGRLAVPGDPQNTFM